MPQTSNVIPAAWAAALTGTPDTFSVESKLYRFYSLPRLEGATGLEISALPISLKILLENLLRHSGGKVVTPEHVMAVANWGATRAAGDEVPYHPVRIVMPDSSGIPLLADLAAMRDALVEFGGDPERVNPKIPLDLVVDHTVAIDVAGVPNAAQRNLQFEFERNGERYSFLRWAQEAFELVRVVPPGNGILHQINLERLAKVVWTIETTSGMLACPEAIIGMDSHTAMINSLGVLGWGVGGIEAATAMLGQPIGIQLPRVVGCRLIGRLRPGITTTDLVLTVTQRLREHGVVGAFVEFCGPGIESLSLPERSTLSNMCPEYGCTATLFPIDRETLRYLTLTGREQHQVLLVEAYAKLQGLWREEASPEPQFTSIVEIDLTKVEPSAAGPRRPDERLALGQVPASFQAAVAERGVPASKQVSQAGRPGAELANGDVVIAAITSCTNTSNPTVMMAAGLLAKKAVDLGLRSQPWVKTSLAPGSQVVADYLAAAGLQHSLDLLGFQLAGFGCTTCMGNSGPLAESLESQIRGRDLIVTAVLSGNRNFESRIHPLAKTNYLVSPPLVVAYALAGSVLTDLTTQPLGHDRNGKPVYLSDVWPTNEEVEAAVEAHVNEECYRNRYAKGFSVSVQWKALRAPGGHRFEWDLRSQFIIRPPFFNGVARNPGGLRDIDNARALAVLGDNVTTDHISPISFIPRASAAGKYLISLGIEPRNFGSYMERRVNHNVMVRGTFANLQLRNEMVPGSEGGVTTHHPDGLVMSIHEAATRYAEEQVELVIVAGKNYGVGSSRDWAAKGTALLGVRAVIAESFERIHRSNLIGMGVLPLEFMPGTTRKALELDGTETYRITGLKDGLLPRQTVHCVVTRKDRKQIKIELLARLDTPREIEWARHGGMLSHALRLQTV
jgi:aconitate hydratase